MCEPIISGRAGPGRVARQHAQQVADLVDMDLQPELAHPVAQQIAAGFFVVAQGQAGAPAVVGVEAHGAEFAQLRQQARAIEREGEKAMGSVAAQTGMAE
jgi:hypothetical protein